MAATLSRRPAKTEPRYHDAGHCLPAAGNRPWRRLQSDAAPIDDLDRGVRNGRNDCTAARAQDQTRLAPRSRMAWAAVAKQQATRSFELRAALSLAKLYQSTARPVEAHAAL